MSYLLSKNANTKNRLTSSDLLGTNVVLQVENSPEKVSIAEKLINKKNGINLKIFSLLRLV